MASPHLRSKIVLITGASSGIGAATARRLAQSGYRLILCARREDRLHQLSDQLVAAHGVDVHTVVADARDASSVRNAIEGLPDDWTDIDVLINNAGLARGLRPIFEAKLEEIDDMVDTNVKGLLYFTRFVVPGMLERGRGHIVNIGSTAGHDVYPGGVVYCATKHAVRVISQGLKMDLHGTPIRVSSVDPGMVETEFSLIRFEGDARRAGSVYEGLTALTPEDVAEAIHFCLSQPSHVNISDVLVMPVDQSSATMIHRSS